MKESTIEFLNDQPFFTERLGLAEALLSLKSEGELILFVLHNGVEVTLGMEKSNLKIGRIDNTFYVGIIGKDGNQMYKAFATKDELLNYSCSRWKSINGSEFGYLAFSLIIHQL